MSEILNQIHECKRGLSTATPSDYNAWWRYVKQLEATFDRIETIIERLESLPQETLYSHGIAYEFRTALQEQSE